MKKQEQDKCRIKGCGRPIEIKKAKMCKRCYAWMRYWEYRSMQDKLNRLDQIEFWRIRAKAVFLMETDNVTPLRGAKRKK